jgi:hypothetical protein
MLHELAHLELDTVQAWLKATNRTWLARVVFIWSTSTSPAHKRRFQNVQIEYARIIVLGLKILNSLYSKHPWPMWSTFQKCNGLGALYKSTRQLFF